MTSPPAHSSPRHLPSRLSQGDSLIRSDEAISLPEAFASFKHELRNLPRLWLSIDLRTVATRVGDGWHNVGTRVYLDPREPGLVTRFPRLPGSDDLLILQDVNAIEELDSLLASVAAGAVNAGGESIRFEAFSCHFSPG